MSRFDRETSFTGQDLKLLYEVSAMAYDAQNRAHSIFWEDEDSEE
jgi:hypothetical protein